jgi:hypothetical protein
LYLPLEPSQRVFEGFTLLQSNFRQRDYTPLLVLTGLVSYGKHYPPKSSGMCRILHPFQKFKRIDNCICRGANEAAGLRKVVGC